MAGNGGLPTVGEYEGNNSIPLIDDEQQLSKAERKLSRFFKCTKFKDKCFWTGNGYREFVEHLEAAHRSDPSFFCIYCDNPLDENPTMITGGKQLADHVLFYHPFRLYQCNLCMYRASRITHLEIHHVTCHPDNFDVKPKGSGKKTQSKIIVCPQIVFGPVLNEDIYWLHYRSDRVNKHSGKFQCLYCNYTHKEKQGVYIHISKSHLDFQMCLYDFLDEAEVSSSQPENTALQPTSNNATSSASILRDQVSSSNLPTCLSPEYKARTGGPGVNVFDSDEGSPEEEMRPFNLPEKPKGDSMMQNAIADSLLEDIIVSSPEKENESNFGSESAAGQSDLSKTRFQRTSAAESQPKPRAIPAAASSSDDDDFVKVQRKRVRRYQNEKDSSLFTPTPIMPPAAGGDRNMVKCILCNPSVKVNKSKLMLHLRTVHETDSSFKCNHCEFVGSKNDIGIHSADKHIGVEGTQFIKFIVGIEEVEAVLVQKTAPTTRETGQNYRGKKQLARKNTTKTPLMQAIKNKVEIRGPGKYPSTSKEPTKIPRPGPSSSASSSRAPDDRSMLKKKQEMARKESEKARNVPPTRFTREEQVHVDKEKVKKLIVPDIEKWHIRTNGDMQHFFCLFCDDTFEDDHENEKAVKHMKKHLRFGYHCSYCDHIELKLNRIQSHYNSKHPGMDAVIINDEEKRRDILFWINTFFNRQFKFAEFKQKDSDSEDSEADLDDQVYVKCPLCVKAENPNEPSVKAKKYTSIKQFRDHFAKHSCYYRCKCSLCDKRVDVGRHGKHMNEVHRNFRVENIDIKKLISYETDAVMDAVLDNIIADKERQFEERLKRAKGITKELIICLEKTNVQEYFDSKRGRVKDEPMSEDESEESRRRDDMIVMDSFDDEVTTKLATGSGEKRVVKKQKQKHLSGDKKCKNIRNQSSDSLTKCSDRREEVAEDVILKDPKVDPLQPIDPPEVDELEIVSNHITDNRLEEVMRAFEKQELVEEVEEDVRVHSEAGERVGRHEETPIEGKQKEVKEDVTRGEEGNDEKCTETTKSSGLEEGYVGLNEGQLSEGNVGRQILVEPKQEEATDERKFMGTEEDDEPMEGKDDDNVKMFKETLTEKLSYGCGHCCRPETRYETKKAWRKHFTGTHKSQGLSKFLITFIRPPS